MCALLAFAPCWVCPCALCAFRAFWVVLWALGVVCYALPPLFSLSHSAGRANLRLYGVFVPLVAFLLALDAFARSSVVFAPLGIVAHFLLGFAILHRGAQGETVREHTPPLFCERAHTGGVTSPSPFKKNE